ncbi:MAG: MurR/RpiR family transcriptional regulator [Chloroflexota bacterium]
MSEQPNVLTRIRSQMPTLSESERRVAQWVLSNANTAMHSSMALIGQSCQVSDTTVLRFCRNLGFRGFTDLKITLAQDLSNPTQLIHDDIEANDTPLVVAKKVFLANIQALYDTLEMLDEDSLQQAVTLLEQANQILLVGVGTSATVCQATYLKLFRLGLPCIVPTDAHVQLMQAGLLGADDLVIAFSHSGETRDPIAILEEAKRHQAKTICVTSNAQSPIVQFADVVLTSVAQETRNDAIASRVAQTTLMDAIYVIASLRDLERTIGVEQRIVNAIIPRTY